MPLALAVTGVGAWDLDVLAGIFYCDRVMCDLYGLPHTEGASGVTAGRIAAIIHPDDRFQSVEKRLDRIRRAGLFVYELRIVPRPSDVRWVLVRGCYEPDESGRIVRGRGIVIDVTGSRQDGYAEGNAFSMADGIEEEGEPLSRAVDHALAARRAIEELHPSMRRDLQSSVDLLLVMLGRRLAEPQHRGR